VNLALRKYSAAASLPLLAHLHLLRHACGFALVDQVVSFGTREN
jgi:hypothetical protein